MPLYALPFGQSWAPYELNLDDAKALVANGVIPQWSLMIINPVVFFIAALAVYGISHLINKKRGFDIENNQPEQAESVYAYNG